MRCHSGVAVHSFAKRNMAMKAAIDVFAKLVQDEHGTGAPADDEIDFPVAGLSTCPGAF
jgi:hypothetical protein